MSQSAAQKRLRAPEPRVEVLDARKGPAFPAGRMLIASPLAVESVVRTIPLGKVLTLGALRSVLAHQGEADYACPLTTSIFLRICAEAAIEEGRTNDVPYWRVVRDDGRLIDKLPGGIEAQQARLESEGVPCTVPPRGAVVVKQFEAHQWCPRR